ncbi:MAG: peptidoglycan DD-metalloendopeptidase family protein [Pseudomonadota bacterium]
MRRASHSRPRRLFALALAAGCAALLGACASRGVPPVADQSRGSPAVQTTYIVKPGDTLYSIAWRHRLDFRRLARRNAIGAPYALRTGQRLVLGGIPAAGSAQTRPTRPSTPAVAAQRPSAQPPRSAPATSPSTARSTPPPATRPAPGASPPVAAGGSDWRRPVAGAVDQAFSVERNGIDFVLGRGETIGASRAGEVVYAGEGLAGFAHLIIIKHSERLLSAYGFDGERLASEGQQLGAGAALGRGGGAGTPLHFEVRHDGEPIDPGALLGS